MKKHHDTLFDVIAETRECWVMASDLRMSATTEGWTGEPTLHAAAVEYIGVSVPLRRQGRCREYLRALAKDPRFELVIVEGVGNPVLAAALTRWGWSCDPRVMDFYWPKSEAAKAAVAAIPKEWANANLPQPGGVPAPEGRGERAGPPEGPAGPGGPAGPHGPAGQSAEAG